ncbi:MAG: signal peptide peptidase SppA [Deltaproteobacteria bacterium]|jgi:protease-4|nr:signal peptide peptidase SppA [Deltaproteobacteria bacterium]
MSSFRQKHPILLGLFILAGIFLLFLGGISLLVSSLISSSLKTDIFTKEEGVGIIELKGLIVSPEQTLRHLGEFRNDPDVKSIVLRIETPGGAVGASQEIYEEVKRTNTVKPVVASMGSMGTSGGYYAALGAESIIANPGTMTGSIGVIVKFPNLAGLYEKIGYESEVVKSGPLKDIGASDRALSEEERQLMQELIDNVYGQFVQDVAAARSLPEETVREKADGRIYTGQQALAIGLIDRLGNFTDAISLAAELGGLETDDPPLIYPKPERKFSLFHLLTGAEQSLVEGLVPLHPVLSYEWAGGR